MIWALGTLPEVGNRVLNEPIHSVSKDSPLHNFTFIKAFLSIFHQFCVSKLIAAK